MFKEQNLEKSPTNLEKMKASHQMYRELLAKGHYSGDKEKRKYERMVLELERQIEEVKHDLFRAREGGVKRERKRGREKVLRGVFEFYCRQQVMVGRKATFEEIEKEYRSMNMGEYMRFCLDFGLPYPKQRFLEVFKKVAPNHHEDISFDLFKQTLIELFRHNDT